MARHLPYEQSPEQGLGAQLRAHDVDPADVDAVVYTHLHWDHAYNASILPAARFFVSPRELEFARDPLPHPGLDVGRARGRWPPRLPDRPTSSSPPRARRSCPASGRSRRRDTAPATSRWPSRRRRGPSCSRATSLPCRRTGSGRIPNGMLHDLEAHFASFARIEALGATVLAAHDPRTLSPEGLPGSMGPGRRTDHDRRRPVRRPGQTGGEDHADADRDDRAAAADDRTPAAGHRLGRRDPPAGLR